MKTIRSLTTMLGLTLVALFICQPLYALNPQPEVPSKPTRSQTNPKALNPQPEVPSKPKAATGDDATNPKALNPQPEVPSKDKKKKTHKSENKGAPKQPK
jgi:hypothetical protein